MRYLKWKDEYLSTEVKQKALLELKKVVFQCKACDLGASCKNKVFADGNPNAKIMLIGEAPGAEEDASGIPFVGRAGKLLTQILTDVGFDRQKDFYIVNTVKCRPPSNRVPTDFEKSCCSDYLSAQINIIKPKVIILCGATALKSFIKEDCKISQIRGQWLDLFGEIKAMAIFHPSYLLRNHSIDKGSPRYLTREDLYKIKNFIEEN